MVKRLMSETRFVNVCFPDPGNDHPVTVVGIR
jgi:hypothetical protein